MLCPRIWVNQHNKKGRKKFKRKLNPFQFFFFFVTPERVTPLVLCPYDSTSMYLFQCKKFFAQKVGKNTSNIKNFSLCFYFLLALSYISFPLSLSLSLEASLMFSVFILCCCFINFVCGICYAVMAKTFAAATATAAH